MYIDYNRSYKRRGKRNNNRKLGIIVLLILICLAIAAAIYFGNRLRKNPSKDMNSTDRAGNVNELSQEDEDMLSITPTISVQPSITPTIEPTPTMMGEKVTGRPSPDPTDTRIPTKVKGVYVTAPTTGINYMNDLIQLVDTTEINAMVIDVKDDHGKISYAMDSITAKEINAVTNTIPDMKGLIQVLKEKNIYLIARIVAFKDPYLAEKRQELAIKNSDGSLFRDNNGEGWVNPYKQEVWDYLVDIATQAAKIGFDEIQFDYIRFSTGEGMSEADFGKAALAKSKEDIITEFTRYIYEKIKPLGVYVSADVYGTIISSSKDAGLVGQDYVEMSKYLDYICPMIYPSHFGEGNYGIKYPDLEPYQIIRKVLTASKEKLDQIPKEEHRAIVRPWLQDFTATWVNPHKEYTGVELRDQINGVYSVAYEEWLLWNASCRYSEDGINKE